MFTPMISILIVLDNISKSLESLRNISREVQGIRQKYKNYFLVNYDVFLSPLLAHFCPFDHICEVPINQKPVLSLSSDFLCFSNSQSAPLVRKYFDDKRPSSRLFDNLSEMTNSTKRYSMINLYPSPHSSAGHFIFLRNQLIRNNDWIIIWIIVKTNRL